MLTFQPTSVAAAGVPASVQLWRRLSATAGAGDWWRVYALLALAAFAIRGSQFGNPMIHVDENFYLLVGNRLLHGALPYVDIWDRKPIGLFLLYAGIRLLGGTGILQYQLVATVFALASACILARIAGRYASRVAAVLTGTLYLLLLGFAGGMGGQAPVFYTPFVAAAALATIRACDDDRADPRRLWCWGAVAMALVGLALQIKGSVVFEGMAFGLVLVRRARRSGARSASLAMIAGWVALALLPTAAALGWYVAIGHGQAFVYANFVSIFERHADPGSEPLRRLAAVALTLALPLAATGLAGWGRRSAVCRSYALALGWLVAALVGFVAFGGWYGHYVLPLFAPLAAACAPLFDRRDRLGLAFAATLLTVGAGGYALAVRQNQQRGGAVAMAAMLDAIRPRLAGCLFVYDGDPMLYHLTGSCLPTRYAFPGHLALQREAGAIGIDQLAELRRIMATRPSVVVDSRQRNERDENPRANALLRGLLRRDYRLAAALPVRNGMTMIYALRNR